MSLELVLLVPVLVLLTVFVLWAGRGGRAALTADLAAEEAATAAALCCEEEDAGEPDRDAYVEDMLEARPGLEYLCVGGLRPEAPADTAGGPDEFIREHWLDFEPGSGSRSGGVGILDVQFGCETDGAVAPLRGLFPTVNFSGQASEVIIRRPPSPNVGFSQTVFRADEIDSALVFEVTSPVPVPIDIRVDYSIISVDAGLTLGPPLAPPLTLPVAGNVLMPAGTTSVDISLPLNEVDTLYEGTEELTVELVQLSDPVTGTQVPPSVTELDPNRQTADGEVLDDDPAPHLFLHPITSPCRVTEGGSVAFEVRLRDLDNPSVPAPSASPVTVVVGTSDITATAGTDYTAVSTTLTFAAGVDTLPVPPPGVQTTDDSGSPVGEDTETFRVALSGEVGAQLGSVTEVTCEIEDNEVRVTAADVTVDEGDPLNFNLSLDRALTADITVDYRLVDHNLATHPAQRGAACATDDDYVELTGQITVMFGHNHLLPVALPAVTTCDDTLVEHDETFWLEISIPSGGGEAVVEDGEGAVGTIRDDDTPTVSITPDPDPATGTEGQTAPLKFTVALTVDGQPARLTQDITVDYDVGGSTATATAPGLPDADYTMSLDTATPAQLSGTTLSGTLTFTAGPPAVTEHVFEAGLLADYLPESDETFVVDLDNLTDPIGAAEFEDPDSDPDTDDSYIDATIVEDPPPELSVGDWRGSEGTDQNFVVTLSDRRAGDTVTVDYAIAGTGTNSATDPVYPLDDDELHDYTAASGSLTGTLTFTGGTTQQNVGVSLRRDLLTELDETLRLVLSNPVRARLTDQPYGEGTIENEPPSQLFIGNTDAREGETLTFTITLCDPIAGEDVTVAYRTQARSAAAGRDFTATNGVLTFSDDPLDPDYVVSLPVTSGCGAGVTADAKTLTVGVATFNDIVEESDEEVHLILSAQTPSHVGFGKAIGVGRIINVSAATVRVSDPTAVEGDPLGFVISLKDETGGLVGDLAPDATITRPVRVYYATQDRTATAGADYTSVPATPGPCLTDAPPPGCPFVEFDPNVSVRDHRVPVTTATDNLDEDDETVALVLRLAESTIRDGSAGLGDTEGTGTIEDAEPPSIRIADASAHAGDTLTFEVTLVDQYGDPATTSEDVTVRAATEDSTATAGLDYTAASGLMTIPTGQSSATMLFEVDTIIDNENYPAETFRVVLSSARNAKIDRAIGIGTINPRCVNINTDDADNRPPTITVHDLTVTEGQPYYALLSFSRPLCDGFALTHRNVSGGALGTATWPSDYGAGYSYGREFTYSYGATTTEGIRQQFWTYGVAQDDLDEDDEWYTIQVRWGPGPGMPAHYQGLGWASGRVTILDDDDLPHLSVADASADEGDPVTFAITKDGPTGRPVTVRYRTMPASGPATGSTDPGATDSDYTAVAWTTHTFAPDEDTWTFDVATVDDGPGDSGETFLVELRAPTDPATPMNALIGDGVAVGTILEGNLPEMRIRDASADEGTAMGFEVMLSEPARQRVTATYTTVERPADLRAATEGTDYSSVSGTIEILVGATTPTPATAISVPILADGDAEVDETFLVELANPSGAALADPSAVATINGDVTCVDLTDPDAVAPVVTASNPIASEGADQMTFTLTADRLPCQTIRNEVVWDRGGTAQPGLDYQLVRLSANIPALGTEATFQVALIDDDIDEPDEQIRLGLWPLTLGGRLDAAGTIVDDDQASLSVTGDSGPEGGFLNFAISLDRASSRDVTVDYATEEASPVSAAAGVDYRARSGTATIAAGELSVTVAVLARQDSLDEEAETFLLRLSNPTGGAELPDAGAVAVGTITDDDDPPTARVRDASADEGEALEFAVTLSAPSGRTVSIPVATRDGTASAADGDYVTPASTHVEFAPGATRQTVPVQTLTDDAVESSEVLWLDLGPMPAGDDTATIGDGAGRGEIRDTSNRQVSVSDAAVLEGGTLAFEIGFSEGPSSRDVTVRYRTRAGTATAGDDYNDRFETPTRELKIVAGATSATVLVPTAQDRLDEDNETLELVLSSPEGAVIVAGAASGVIIDDDPEPALRVGDTEATEADGASATFTLSLSEASGRAVTVTHVTADGTASAGTDYTALAARPPGTTPMTTIRAGDTAATVDVALVDDDVEEDVETFQLRVTSAVNAQRDDSTGVATIIDDDGPIQVIVDDPADVYEGDSASAAFTVRLSRADPDNPVTVTYSTADGTATAGNDYTAASSQTLTFAAGSDEATVTVPLINDDTIEDAETFRLVLSGPSSNAEIGDGEATVLILDDDGLPALSVADAAAADEGSTASFTVTLSRAVPQDVTVGYATLTDPAAADETAAAAGLDYTATSGTATIAARATSTTVTVPLLQDSFDENTETFWLRLSSPTAATITDGTATATIDDDDPLPAINISDTGAEEGSTLSFDVRLDATSGRTVTVPWATEALPAGVSAASPGEDYTTASGTVTFAPGSTAAQVRVASLPDDIDEADERFLVQLGTPANAALDDGAAVGAILDDDGEPRILIGDATVDENDGPAIFEVTLSHPSSQPVTVGYDSADGTATECGSADQTEDCDYAPDQVKTLTIPAAFDRGEISVFINDDTDAEGTETFTVTLTDPVNAVIAEGAGTATGTILDDEGEPRLSVAGAQECEDGSGLADCTVRLCRIPVSRTFAESLACQRVLNDPGACQEGMCGGDGTLEFAVQLSHASTEDTSVRYSTVAAGAASPRDYVATTGTLTIPAGATTASIRVTLVDDGVHEQQTETFRLVLDNPEGVELVTAQAAGTIRDDDPTPRVSAEPFDAFSNENDGFAYHRLTLSHPSELTATVGYRFGWVGDRSGLPSLDDTPGTLTFAPGVVEQTIEVPLLDNDVSTDTPNLTFRYANTFYRIELRDYVNLSTRITSGTGVVWDDETAPYVESVAAQDVLEGAGSATFTITLNRLSDTAVTATYRTADGTATAGSDYTATEATVTFPAGTVSADVSVPILDDTDIEADETFTLSIIDDPRNSNLTYLANPIDGGQHGIGSTTVTIIDDDTDPEISVADTSANENAGTMPFRVSLSRATATAVTVDYATTDGTAVQPGDYTETSGRLTIPAGATSAEVAVPIIDDGDDTESDETFELNLSNANGATIADADATGTIIEDANLQTITMDDQSRSENIRVTSRFIYFRADVGEVGETATRNMWVDWQVVEVPSLGDEAATIGADFLASPSSGTLSIPSGRTGRSMNFEIVADMIPERDERFQVILSNPRGATLGNTRAWGTIENDDLPIVTLADAQASEADDAVVFDLQLHAPGLDPASLAYTAVARTSAGDAAASPGEDYTSASGTLDIPAGATTATISVPIIADTADEEDETFLLVLTSPENLEFRDTVAVGTITDDDDGYWIRDRSVWENAATMDFTVRRDHTDTSAVTVNYRIGTGGSAVGGTACTDDDDNYIADYVTPSGAVTMAAAATDAAVSIEICDDEEAEGRENLLLELTNVTGRQTIAVGTIVDDDRTDLPRINIGDSASRTETLHATLGAEFQITADGPLTDTVTVTWRTENCLAADTQCPNPATAGDDYTAATGTVTLTPANPSATVTVTVLDDTTTETDEQFFVRITGVAGPAAVGSGATHTDPVGIGRITDDDDVPSCINPNAAPDPLNPPTLTTTQELTVTEGDPLSFTLALSPAGFCSSIGIEVGFGSAGDTAVLGSDYTAIQAMGWSGLFRNESTTAVLAPSWWAVVDDDIVEDDETFTFTVAFCGRLGAQECGGNHHADYANLPIVEVTVTIEDND